MEAIRKLQLFWKCFWLGLGVKKIIDSLSFLFLLTHIGINFNEKVLEQRANLLYLSHFFKTLSDQTIKNGLKIIPYFASAPYIYIHAYIYIQVYIYIYIYIYIHTYVSSFK